MLVRFVLLVVVLQKAKRDRTLKIECDNLMRYTEPDTRPDAGIPTQKAKPQKLIFAFDERSLALRLHHLPTPILITPRNLP
jgi:hypothetical protein